MMCLSLRRAHLPSAAAWLTIASAALAQTSSPTDVLSRAMHDELRRSMDSLHLASSDRPYFIAYRVREIHSLDVGGSLGSLTGSKEARVRSLSVELRVGSYQLDNSKANAAWRGAGAADLPLDDDYQSIRRAIWLATDAAYKRAVEAMATRRASLADQTRSDTIPDFSKETPTHTVENAGGTGMTLAEAESLAHTLSTEPALAGLFTSRVQVAVYETQTWYVNSEGTTINVSQPLVAVNVAGTAQASDGMPLANAWGVRAYSTRGLPTTAQMLSQIHAMAVQLDSLQKAPVLDRYEGPILFAGTAAGELFSDGMGRWFGQHQRELSTNIGTRVLPDFLTVIDDPTRTMYDSVTLFGAYHVDDDGVVGRPHTVIDSGRFKTLLATRTPIEGALQSTGNHRGYGAFPSNVFVTPRSTLSDADLKTQLLALVKQHNLPYGVVIRNMSGGGANMVAMMTFGGGGNNSGDQGIPIQLAYKVFPDGHEELMRGAQLSPIAPELFKTITAASRTCAVYTIQGRPWSTAMNTAGGSSFLPSVALTSYVVPSLLFDDLTMPKFTGDNPKPPYSVPPG